MPKAAARAAQGLLTTASKAPGGGYGYNTASVPLLAEALKLVVSAWLLARQRRVAPEAARTTRSLRGAALFVVPSLIYWLHNNVQARPRARALVCGRLPRCARGRVPCGSVGAWSFSAAVFCEARRGPAVLLPLADHPWPLPVLMQTPR